MNSKDLFIEEFSFVDFDYFFKKFEGSKTIISSKYGFKVKFYNSIDFRSKDSIEYSIEIPYNILNSLFGVKTYEEIELSENQDEVFSYLGDIRSYIEKEILEYLKQNNLTIERDNY